METIKTPSPNFSISKYKKVGIQIHKTLGSMPETLNWMRNPKSQASCNILFARNGDVYELVSPNKRAWSAGRINQPSERVKHIMFKNIFGKYVKPGYYLLEFEFECLLSQTYTEAQYKSVVKYMKENISFSIVPQLFWTHKDTAIDKPNLEKERLEILKRYNQTIKLPQKTIPSKSLIINKNEKAEISVVDGKIIIKKI